MSRRSIFNVCFFIFALSLIITATLIGPFISTDQYSDAADCSIFNGDQTSCEAHSGCEYHVLSPCNFDESTCLITGGCTANNGDCGVNVDESSCLSANAACSWNGSSCDGGTYFTYCSGEYMSNVCTGNYDSDGPVFSSATVLGTSMVISFNESLSTSVTPATSDFTVTVNGNPVTVNSVGIGGTNVSLTLATPAAYGESVFVTYIPGINIIQDTSGNQTTGFNDQSVTNQNDGDTPVLQYFTSDTADGTYYSGQQVNIKAVFHEALRSGSTMTVVLDTGASVVLSSVVGSNLSGTYTIGAGQSSSDLTVSSITSASVSDAGYNTQTDYSVPLSPFTLADNKDIVVALDTTAPTLTSFTGQSGSGKKKAGDTVSIRATFSEAISSTSTMTVALNSGGSVTLSTVSGSTLTGTYTVMPDDYTLAPLKVSSITSASVADAYSNGTSTFSMPADSSNINNIAYVILGKSNFLSGSTVSAGTMYTVGTKLYAIKSGGIGVFDLTTNSFIKTITITNPFYFVPYGTKLFVIPLSGGSVYVIDTRTDTLTTTISTTGTSYDLTVVGNKVFVTKTAGSVVVINGATNSVITTISGTGGGATWASFLGQKVYVTSNTSSKVSIINATSNTTLATISSPSVTSPYYLASSGNKVYVSDTSNVRVIDGTSNSLLTSISTGIGFGFITAIKDRIYSFGNTGFSIINTASDSLVTTMGLISGGVRPITLGNKLFFISNGATATSTTVYSVNYSDNATSSIYLYDSGYNLYGLGTKIYSGTNVVNVYDSVTGTSLNRKFPQLVSFSTSASSGTSTAGSTITITATFDSNIQSGSTMTVALNSGGTATLSTVSGATLSGTYTVGANDSTPDLSVSSITSASVTETTYNHTETSYSVPISGEFPGETKNNIGNSKNITIGNYIKIPVQSNPYGVVTVGTNVYVANQASGTVSIINSSTKTASSTTVTVGTQPYGMALNGTKLYVANIGSNNVSVIDTTTNTVSSTVTVGNQPYYVTSSGSYVYVTNSMSNDVYVIDTATDTVTTTISVGKYPRGLKVYGTKLYVANYNSYTVSVIDLNTNTVTSTIDVGRGPRGVAIHGSDVYVTNYDDNTVSVINTATDTVTATISVGRGPRGITSVGSYMYVANYIDGTISVINTSNNTVTATTHVGTGPANMTAVGTDLYISRFEDDSVSIFDTTNNTLKAFDTTAPVISSLSAISVSTSTSTIIWNTNEAATSTVFYGLTSGYGSSTSSGTATTSHSFSLSGLSQNTAYHYMVSSADSSGNTATSSDGTFTTSITDSTIPIISISAPTNTVTVSGNSVTFSATASDDVAVSGVTFYAESTAIGSEDTSDPYSVTWDSTGVADGLHTLYAVARDTAGNHATSSVTVTVDNIANSTSTTTSDISNVIAPVTGGGGGGGGATNIIYGNQNTTNNSVTVNSSNKNTGFSNVYTTAGIPPGYSFKVNASVGNSNRVDIQMLQKFLNTTGYTVSKSGVGSPGRETKSFGPATRNALIKFQKAMGIKPAIGYFGPVTRTLINKLLGATK